MYPPFGMLQPGRAFESGGYRFGFNGQEKDDEVYGTGNLNTALFWEYDTRLGRRWNRDPKGNEWESSYETFGCNPIKNVDRNGDVWNIVIGAAIGGAIELGGQLIANGGNIRKVDWVDVGVETGKGALIASGVGASWVLAGSVGGDVIKAGADFSADEQKYIGGDNIENNKSLTDAGIDFTVDHFGGKFLDKKVVGKMESSLKNVLNYDLTKSAVKNGEAILEKNKNILEKKLSKDVSAIKKSTQSAINRVVDASKNLNSSKATLFAKDVVLKPTVNAIKAVGEAVENKISEGFKWLKNKIKE